MAIINMYDTKAGTIIKKQLEGLVGTEISEQITIWGHKHLVKVENIDVFHKIAQASSIKEVRSFHGIDFILEQEIVGSQFLTGWTVMLPESERPEFLTKYGECYKITK